MYINQIIFKMKKKVFQSAFYISLILFMSVWSSCESDDPIPAVELTAKVELTGVATGSTVDELTIKVKSIQTGVTKEFIADAKDEISMTLEEGVYNFEATGKISYAYTDYEGQEQTKTESIAGLTENISISSTMANRTVAIQAFITNSSGTGNNPAWVIKEIYSAGTKTSVGNKNYTNVQFVEIYNNSGETLYADGLAIGETGVISSSQPNYYAADMAESTFVHTLYSVPGDGTKYPVEPGKSILIAPYPINHPAEFDPVDNKLLDLSIADFQWYDDHRLALQVPEVPDLVKHYSYSATIWILTTQTNRGFVLFKTDNIADYVTENMDIRKNNAGNDATAVRLDNAKVLDAVDMGHPDKIKVKTISPSLDLGFTYCSETFSGKSVRRKVSHVESDGRVVYQDTNNSSVDFITDADPQPKQFKAS